MLSNGNYYRQANYSKFYPTKRDPRFFAREHILERLDSIEGNRFILLQAPEGYGKSSFLSDWYQRVTHEEGKKILWFRVDAYDNEPECFWSNLIEAMDMCWPGIKSTTLNNMDMLEQSSALQLILALANYIVLHSDENLQYIMIFDDFECFKLSESEGQLFLFANMLPANISFVIASREYLNNQLLGQSGYGPFSFIGVTDLAVSKGELSEMLRNKGHIIPESLLNAIYLKTEGWPFAIYALLEQTDRGSSLEKAVETFSGSNRFLGDTIFERATQDLPQKDMAFLLETSFFECFSEQLCNFVFENKEAHAIIQDLERRGLFIFPIDSTRVWYRYHSLFAEWLKNHSMSMRRDQIRNITFKAANWYYANDKPLLSAKHTVASSEGNFILGLSKYVFPHSPIKNSELLSFIINLRESDLMVDPSFCLLATWAYVFTGKPKEAKEWLYRTKDLIDKGRATAFGTVIQHEEASEENPRDKGLRNRIMLVVRVIESKCLTLEGRAQQGIEETNALLLEEGTFLDDRLKMVLYQVLGESYELLGDTDAALKYYQKAMTIAQVNAYDFLVGFTRYQIIRLMVEQGKLSEAKVLCRMALANCPPDFTVYGALYSILGYVNILQKQYGDLEIILKRATGRVSLNRNLDIYLDVCRTRLHYLIIHGNYSEAFLQTAIARSAILESKDNPPRGIAPIIYAEQARLYLKLKDVESAKDTLKELESLNYFYTAESTLQCGILTAMVAIEEEQVSKDTITELTALIPQAEKGNYLLYLIDVHLLASQLHFLLNEHSEAITSIRKAIELARKEQIIYLFLRGGKLIYLLLTECVGTRGLSYESGAFARKIISELEESDAMSYKGKPDFDWISNASEKSTPTLVGHWGLTGREEEVLQLLVRGMNRKEIAAELCTSQNTIKTHISHIYEKMDVHSVAELLRKMVESEVL